MFNPDENFSDEKKKEETELNFPSTITVPSGASHDFMKTKSRWSFQHIFWLTAKIYPIHDPTHPNTLEIKRETHAFAKHFVTLTVYKKYPELHLTQHIFQVFRELKDTADFHLATRTGCYIEEIKEKVPNQSN